MADAVTITYGGYTMGPGRPKRVVGISRADLNPFTEVITWQVLLTADDSAALATAAQALEDAMSQRFQRLTVDFGSDTQWDFDPSSNTGFNQVPSAAKVGDEVDGPKSRLYECSVEVQKPASDNSGRRESEVELDLDDSQIGTLTVTAVYTAEGGSSAYANAQSKFPTFLASVKSSMGGTFDESTTRYTHDDQNKICTVRDVSRRLHYAQSGSGLNDSRLTNATIFFNRSQASPGDTPGRGAVRLETLVATYTSAVSVDSTTNLTSLIKTVVEPYMIAQARALYSPRLLVITSRDPDQNKSGNRISVRLTFLMATAGSSVYSYIARQTYRTPGGRLWVPKADGNQYSVYEYEIPIAATRTTVVSIESHGADSLDKVAGLGALTPNSGSGGRPPKPGDVSGNWRVEEYSEETFPMERGLVEKLPTTAKVYRIVERYVEVTESSSSGTDITPTKSDRPPTDVTPRRSTA